MEIYKLELIQEVNLIWMEDFTIDEGIYDFKYGGVINKPFNH